MPMIRRTLLAFALLMTTTAGIAAAAEPAAFTADALAQAQAAGKPILVEIHAPWCPTCKAQQPILSELKARPAYAGLKVLRVDFDSQKDAVRQLGATSQSTLIAFKGRAETARSVGDTNPGNIEKLVASAFAG